MNENLDNYYFLITYSVELTWLYTFLYIVHSHGCTHTIVVHCTLTWLYILLYIVHSLGCTLIWLYTWLYTHMVVHSHGCTLTWLYTWLYTVHSHGCTFTWLYIHMVVVHMVVHSIDWRCSVCMIESMRHEVFSTAEYVPSRLFVFEKNFLAPYRF